MFSKRTEWDTDESEMAQAYRERRAQGLPVMDLTASNPTRAGFAYAEDLLAPLADARALDYDPNPKGSVAAREAVCRYYAELGAEVDAEQVVLTTSTSEAYSYLFKLLCDPGDVVLAQQPSYPLFDFLARAECVELEAAPLVYDFGWQLDVAELERRITPRTKALVLVHPNNPTGHFTKGAEAEEIGRVCREHGVALIVDEVFLDYALMSGDEQDRETFLKRDIGVPVFVVSGISKICGLPQVKAAWIVADGPGWREAMARLEVVADTFLSMNAPVQRALPVWLERREEMQGQIRERVVGNLAELDLQIAASAARGEGLVSRLAVEGGWYVVLRIPATQLDEVTALELLDCGVWVHPGHFFGMAESGWLVVSLLAPLQEFAAGITELLSYLSGRYTV
ncbi:pyridoxal phosphate-dependent aminotransferase [Acidicapsa dinghuensis]|uniref:Pyridoxal phosphate-dependent aminotransferase n=1 Tax=Acidicapsa dinghuensis TaxID=2218256 RepID=A0ABW1EGD3_9BACT|nr:pyridoxal phosphate-dependent aminotransferase [Acidicapsa dinghuensis]